MNFDNLTIDQSFKTDSYKIIEEEIIAFASEYDPQYFHVDANKAEKSIFKSIIASGLHTLNLSFKLWAELDVFGHNLIAGKGIDNIKFIKPVYPEDVLHVFATIINKKEREKSGEIIILLSTYKNNEKIQVLKAELTVLISK